MSSVVAERPPVGLGTKLLYSSGALANQIKQQSLSLLLLLYYNQVVGLDPRLVSAAIMVTLVFDAVVDPLMGQISDNFRSAWGRRHPFMYASALPVALAFFMIWNPPQGWSDGATFAYMLSCLLTIRFFDTCFELPSTALAPELAADYDARTRLLALRTIFGVFGTLLITIAVYQVFMPQKPDGSGGVTDAAGYLPFSLAASAAIFLIIILSSAGTHGQIPYLSKAPERAETSFTGMLREIVSTLRNRDFATIAIAGMVLAIGAGLTQSLQLYIGLYYWGLSQNQLTLLGIAFVLSAMAGAVLAPQVVKRIDKRRGSIFTGSTGIVLSISPIVANQFGLMPAHGSSELFIALMCFSLGTQAFMLSTAVTIQAMIADVVEDSAVRTGRRSEGLLFAADNLFKKAVSGLGVLVAGQLLFVANFPKDVKVTGVDAATLDRLGWAYVAALVFFYGGCLFALSFYTIDRARHEANLQRLNSRNP